MSSPEEYSHPDDIVILTVDIENCPIVEIPLTELYNVTSEHLKDDYLVILRHYVTQQLEDTTWLEDQSVTPLFDAGFATYHRRNNGDILFLRKPALLRLIKQSIRCREGPDEAISIAVLICFMISAADFQRRRIDREPSHL